jgi:hypothetical protein
MVATTETNRTDPRFIAMQDKLHARIDRMETLARPQIGNMERHQELLKDRIVTLGIGGHLRFDHDPAAHETRAHIQNAPTGANVNPSPATVLRMTPHAVAQAAQKFGVPEAWAKEQANSAAPWQRELIAQVLNVSAEKGPRQRVLVRAVGSDARAVLSDKYRRLDSWKIAADFIQGAQTQGMSLTRAEMDETQLSVEMTLPMVFTHNLRNAGVEFCAYGARLRNSDFGEGALSLSLFCDRIQCVNLQVFSSVMKTVHLGRRLPDNLEISAQTFRLDTQASASLVRDYVRNLLTPAAIEQRNAQLITADAQTMPEDWDALRELPKLGSALNKADAAAVLATLTRNDPEEIPTGRLTAYKVSQAIANVGQKGTQAKRRDLELIAGKMLEKATA